MWNLKSDTNELIYETESQMQRRDCQLPRGRGGGKGTDWDSGITRWKLAFIEWINNKVVLYSMGTIFTIM